MSLDRKFATLVIEPSKLSNRRLSGQFPIIPVMKELREADCSSSSSGSSVDGMDELSNENTPTPNNNSVIEEQNCATISLRRSSRKRVCTATLPSAFVSGGYSKSSSKFAKLANPKLQDMPFERSEGTHRSNDVVEYLKEIYLDKTVKLKHNALETIFEEPKAVGRAKGNVAVMSGRKFRRFISFDETVSNITKKTKKRSMKAKVMNSKTRTRFNVKRSAISF